MTEKANQRIKMELSIRTGILDLSACQLTHIPSDLLNMPWLRQLNFSNNYIHKVENLHELLNLHELTLENNHLSEIKNLERLKNLKYLFLSNNEISEISNLDNLSNLRFLCLSANKIEEIKNLSFLQNLKLLDLNNNKIKEIKGLDNLTNLHDLNLGVNQITEIKNLSRLYYINNLNISDNLITEIKNLNKLHHLQIIVLTNNPIKKIKNLKPLIDLPKLSNVCLFGIGSNDLAIPPEIFGSDEKDNCLKALRGYFLSLKKGQLQLRELPVILVGNTTAGKTSLRYFLQHNIFPPPNDLSTHGIEPSIWQPDEELFSGLDSSVKLSDLQLYFWDFGGQEYYHATHRLFFSKRAIYILVWEKKTNRQDIEILPYKKQYNEKGTIEVKNMAAEIFPYEYWINSIRHRAPDPRESPIIMVQNKMDIEGNEIEYPDQDFIKKNNCKVLQLSIHSAYKLSGEGKKDPYVDILLHQLFSAAKQLSSTLTYGAIWEEIKLVLQSSRNDNVWTKEKFISELQQLDPELQESSMLSYAISLRAMGLIIYEYDNDVLENFVFINPGWVTQTIYAILDDSILKNNGEFNKLHVIEKTTPEYAEAFITLMKKFELIFEDEELEIFIAPQYLPSQLADIRKRKELEAFFEVNISTAKIPIQDGVFQEAPPDFVIRFSDFMPRYVMIRFLVAHGRNAISKYFWKAGIAFILEKKYRVLVLCDYDKKQFRVYVEDGNIYVQKLIFDKLIHFSENTSSLSIAAKSHQFVSYLNLKNASNMGYSKINDIDNKIVEFSRFRHFFVDSEKLRTQNAGSKLLQNIMVFISYAHQDNEHGQVELFRNELESHLKALEKSYKFTIFKDDQINIGDKWEVRLQREIDQADIAILLLSDSFFTSDYISEKELASLIELNENSKKNIICPLSFAPFRFDLFHPLSQYQFFKPNGNLFGPSNSHFRDEFCFCDLIQYNPQNGLPLPNVNRSRYMLHFVQAIEKAIKAKE